MIIVAANLSHVPKHFANGLDRAIIKRCVAKFARALGVPKDKFANKIKEFKSFMKEVNKPSNNSTTAMTRAVIYKYGLIECQDAYFRDMNVPNPIIQKALRDLMVSFIWDWDEISDNYRIDITEEEEVTAE